jgi:cytosine/creatinine deaminase
MMAPANEGVSVLANVSLGDAVMDIVMQDGRISGIAPGLADATSTAIRIEGNGALALSGLVDGHMHLDKTLTGCAWMPHRAGPERMSRIEKEKELRGILPPVAERAANLVRRCIAHGTTAIRTHVDVDPELGLSHVHALAEVRERFAKYVDIQIVAFPQSGVVRCPGTAELLEAALQEGADLLGGLDPLVIDDDLDGQLTILFNIAERRGVGIDIHLHDAGTHGLAEIAAVTDQTLAAGMTGRVTVSHGFCLGAANDDDFARTADAMAEAGVSLVTHGGAASPLPPVKALRQRGVTVFAGNDDVRDPWSPFGNGDMLERAMLLAWRSGYRTDGDLEIAFECASSAGAEMLGCENYGLAVGDQADFMVVNAHSIAEAVAQRARRNLVFKAGRLVAQGGEFVGNA